MTVQKKSSNAIACNIQKEKQTSLGLYVVAKEAYDMWRANPDKVKILDVRTPEEYLFVGHADMARNIPLGFIERQWDSGKDEPVFTPNPEFLSSAKRQYGVDDTIMVACRSGGRAARAIDLLSEMGFRNVYNIVDGMEGDTVNDPDSVFHGKRMKNGWKNSGLPWTYGIDPELFWISKK